MNRSVESSKSFGVPVFAGNIRFLIGLFLLFVGLYVALLSNIEGHGLGYFLIFLSPFVAFKDIE